MKANGEMVQFLKQRDYEMINNNLGSGSFGQTVLLKDPFIDELFVAKKYEPYYDEDKKEFFDSFLQEIKIIDFGLGKTFSPIDSDEDSMVEIINRSGLDCLPNEYFEGKYDARTDMFYLAELFGRLLRITGAEEDFSYRTVLSKMMMLDKYNGTIRIDKGFQNYRERDNIYSEERSIPHATYTYNLHTGLQG